MMNRKLLGICIVILFFLSANGVQAQRNNSSISGFVFGADRRPLAQVYVELIDDVNRVVGRVRTDGSGRYLFNGLPGGRFTVRVLPLGTNYEEQTQEVELVTFGGLGRNTPEFAQKDFYLRLRRNSNGEVPITGTVFAQEVPKESQAMYEKAISSLDNKKTAEAVAELEEAVKLFPDYYLALEKLGAVYIDQQQYDKARDVFTKAVKVNERGFNSWYGLSYANYSLKQSDAAIEAAQKAVSLNSSSVEAQMFLGISFRQAKQYDKAEKSLLEAKKLANGTVPNVFWNLALLYAHNFKRYKDAANELELYLKSDPNIPDKESIRKLIKHFRENPPSK